jgi:two-component system, OmpR family, KDP operon response regulator KdpE
MTHGRTHILVVDDDPGILTAIKQALVKHQYEVTTAVDGVEALDLYQRLQPDLLLLDLMMPRLNGLEVCRQIRAQAPTPIIILSVKGSEADIVSALDLGADDYLVKPFRLAELLARLRAVLRRGGTPLANRIVCGDLEIDTERHRVTVASHEVPLSPIEYAVLAELARNAGRVLTTRMLLQRVWGNQYLDAGDYVKAVVRRLRVKLEPDPNHPRYIITERYLGYRLNDLGTK